MKHEVQLSTRPMKPTPPLCAGCKRPDLDKIIRAIDKHGFFECAKCHRVWEREKRLIDGFY